MIQQNRAVQFILYVADQKRSRDFYEKVLGYEPVMDVPGMTEFQLTEFCKLGLMPEEGIAKILQPETKHPASANGIPRCELYLMVDSPSISLEEAINLGARKVSDTAIRDWGHEVAYVQDFDGHIVAFARVISS
jgi:catechol 2,3-dioxygenase-like lactoylglutathione lyase family enzyme